MEYECKPCNYKTDRYLNFIRHEKSSLHNKRHNLLDHNLDVLNKIKAVEKIDGGDGGGGDGGGGGGENVCDSGGGDSGNEDIILSIYICKNCGEKFDGKYKKYRHQKKCSGKNSNSSGVNESKKNKIKKDEISNTDLLKMLMEKDKKFADLIDIAKESVHNTTIASKTTKKSMHMMQYAIMNFKNAPVLTKLEPPEVCGMIGYTGNLDSYDDIKPYVEQVLVNYDKENIPMHFGKMIALYFCKASPEEQRAWSTDVSRLSFIVMQYINYTEEKEWITDKSGIKFTNLVINPMFAIVRGLLNKYNKFESEKTTKMTMEECKKMTTSERDRILRLTNLSLKLIQDIDANTFTKDILKFVAPYFNFDNPKIDELKKLEFYPTKIHEPTIEENPKKIQKTKIIKQITIFEPDLVSSKNPKVSKTVHKNKTSYKIESYSDSPPKPKTKVKKQIK